VAQKKSQAILGQGIQATSCHCLDLEKDATHLHFESRSLLCNGKNRKGGVEISPLSKEALQIDSVSASFGPLPIFHASRLKGDVNIDRQFIPLKQKEFRSYLS
jgi:hypothetical protein